MAGRLAATQMRAYLIFYTVNGFRDLLIKLILVIIPAGGHDAPHGFGELLVGFKVLPTSCFVIDYGVNGNIQFSDRKSVV